MAEVSLLGLALRHKVDDKTETILLSTQNDFDRFIRPIIFDAVMCIDLKQVASKIEPVTKYMSSKDIEKQFGISENTLEHWRSRGIGPTYIQVGRRIFYERHAFECFFKSCEVKTTGRIDE